MRIRTRTVSLGGIFAQICLLCSPGLAQPAIPLLPPPILTLEEKVAAARAAVSADLMPFGIQAPRDPSRRVLTGVVSADMKPAGSSSNARLALVMQYDYDLHSTLRSLVNVATGNVMGVIVLANDSPPLSPGEYARANSLALSHPRVQDVTRAASLPVRAEAGLSLISDQNDKLHGHRIARVQFHTDAGYLRTPFAVYVDLTNNTVHLR